MLYCAKFYGRGFIRVYEDKTPVIKLCTVQHYPIIILTNVQCTADADRRIVTTTLDLLQQS